MQSGEVVEFLLVLVVPDFILALERQTIDTKNN
jgi:hypothetical protein